MYYKHLFNKPGNEIAIDLSYYTYKAVNSTSYISDNTDFAYDNHTNMVKPKQNSVSIRIDYSTPLTEKLSINTGLKAKFQILEDRQSDAFNYDEDIFAAYASFNYKIGNIDVSAGVRTEKSSAGLKNSFNNNVFALLPHAVLNYQLTPKQSLKLSYRRAISRPYFYQLNPYTYVDDPISIRSGNPDLKPQFHHNLFIDYAVRLKDNYISTRLFYQKTSNVINSLTFINDSSMFETRLYNLGDIHQYGIQLSGALKLTKTIGINPYLKLFNLCTRGNTLAKQHNIENRQALAFESGLSAIVTFKHNLVASLLFQYNSPKNNIQNTTFYDALYFISLEKTFKQKFKIGIMSGIPFAKSFTYQGSEIKATDFYSHSEGDIKMSVFPIWLKFKYQFNSGKKGKRINRTKETIDNKPKKGF
ncbi:TonB-dependent receptor [Marinilabiliaceae bacterium JC017]|nr:TonB-dependent receptor [Marinilabiliaceae bacterium JC017]